MVFEIKNKIALITGGVSGLGLHFAKELLRNGAKGVTLADVNCDQANKALEEIEKEFGPNKAIFVQTDVVVYEQFENAFLETIKVFKFVDILFNNAGIGSDVDWDKLIRVNFNGSVNGMFLGFDKYLPKYKQTEEALIVNTASIAGTQAFAFSPVYAATKHAIIGTVRSWGIPEFYEETKVRVVAICPGITRTPMYEVPTKFSSERFHRYTENNIKFYPVQEAEFVAKETMRVVEFAKNGTSWVIEGGEPAYEFLVAERSTMKNNVLLSQ